MQGGKKVASVTATAADGAVSVRSSMNAYGGDIIGVFDPGIFSIGDTLTACL